VDGMVLATAHLSDPLLADAARAGLPVVLMNRMAQDHSLDSVSVDNERGMRMAVAHLVSEGHRRIAHIAGPQEVSTGLSRYRGFLSAMEAHGLEADPDLIITAKAFSIEEGMRCTRALLERRGSCTAVAAGNDMLAVGCFAALEEAGLNCPADLSVVGFNDMPFIDRLRPPLTTIRFPHYQLGTEAAQLLLERIGGQGGPVRVMADTVPSCICWMTVCISASRPINRAGGDGSRETWRGVLLACWGGRVPALICS